jgi:hypothetical protein
MDNRLIIGIITSILVGLMSWNLSQTFSLSKDMVLLKEKISNIEDKVSKFKPNKKKKKKKKN